MGRVRNNDRAHKARQPRSIPDKPSQATVLDVLGAVRHQLWWSQPFGKGMPMAAMKPRTGDGPLEVTKEGRGIVMRVPLEGGGRLVVELNAQEAKDLGDQLVAVVS